MIQKLLDYLGIENNKKKRLFKQEVKNLKNQVKGER